MQTRILFAFLSLELLSACNQKKFDSDIATRAATSKPPVKEETTLPVVQKPDPIVTEEAILPKPVVPEVKPVDTSIEFGATEIFRIGDGFASSGSACVGQVNTFKLSGTKYYFQFEVTEDDTQIDLSIGRICGVDQLEKDTFSLINEGSKKLELVEKALPKQIDIGPDKPWVPYPAFTLKKGIYSVVIHSKNIYNKEVVPGTPIDPDKDEHDDFLVGNIKLKATKKVNALKIYAE